MVASNVQFATREALENRAILFDSSKTWRFNNKTYFQEVVSDIIVSSLNSKKVELMS